MCPSGSGTWAPWGRNTGCARSITLRGASSKIASARTSKIQNSRMSGNQGSAIGSASESPARRTELGFDEVGGAEFQRATSNLFMSTLGLDSFGSPSLSIFSAPPPVPRRAGHKTRTARISAGDRDLFLANYLLDGVRSTLVKMMVCPTSSCAESSFHQEQRRTSFPRVSLDQTAFLPRYR